MDFGRADVWTCVRWSQSSIKRMTDEHVVLRSQHKQVLAMLSKYEDMIKLLFEKIGACLYRGLAKDGLLRMEMATAHCAACSATCVCCFNRVLLTSGARMYIQYP